MTDDNLPPLPRNLSDGTFTRDAVIDYVRAAIEADRAARGAPKQVAQPGVHEQVLRALAGLLEQVEGFVSAHGEADFETAEALHAVEAAVALESRSQAKPEQQAPKPVDMVLHCPSCGMQHVDAPSPTDGQNLRLWSNPPHRSHLCRPEDGGCGHIWRPADVHTNGVAAVKTTGKADSQVAQAPNAQQAEAQPVAEFIIGDDEFDLGLTYDYAFGKLKLPNGRHMLYAAPPKAAPLTEEQAAAMARFFNVPADYVRSVYNEVHGIYTGD